MSKGRYLPDGPSSTAPASVTMLSYVFTTLSAFTASIQYTKQTSNVKAARWLARSSEVSQCLKHQTYIRLSTSLAKQGHYSAALACADLWSCICVSKPAQARAHKLHRINENTKGDTVGQQSSSTTVVRKRRCTAPLTCFQGTQ